MSLHAGDAMSSVSELTKPNHEAYCKRWGYTYLSALGAEWQALAHTDYFSRYPLTNSRRFLKLTWLSLLLRTTRYARIFWTDADAVFTMISQPLPELPPT